MRYSKPLDGQNSTAVKRFWAKVDKTGDCWQWTASVVDGYGQFRIGGSGSRNVRAHVVAYTWAHGPIPDGMVLDHLCRNRACVNPDHLDIITPEENSTRGMMSRHATIEFCPNGHRWDARPVYLSGGYRVCGSCMAERRSTEEAKEYHREYLRTYRRDEAHRELDRVRAREYRARKKLVEG